MQVGCLVERATSGEDDEDSRSGSCSASALTPVKFPRVVPARAATLAAA